MGNTLSAKTEASDGHIQRSEDVATSQSASESDEAVSSDDGTSLFVLKTAGRAPVCSSAQVSSAAPASAKVAKLRSAGKGKHAGPSKASSRPTAPPAPREVAARDSTLPKQRQQEASTLRPVVSVVQYHGPPFSRPHLLRTPWTPSTCLD